MTPRSCPARQPGAARAPAGPAAARQPLRKRIQRCRAFALRCVAERSGAVQSKCGASDLHEPPIKRGSPCAISFGVKFGRIKRAALRVSHDPGHILNLKLDSHQTLILPKGKGNNAKATGVYLFRAPVTWLKFVKTIFHLQMSASASSESESSNCPGPGLLAVIRAVNSHWLLRMGPSLRGVGLKEAPAPTTKYSTNYTKCLGLNRSDHRFSSKCRFRLNGGGFGLFRGGLGF